MIGNHDGTLSTHAQYDKLANDWRHINTIVWGIPTVAVTLVAGVIVAAYGQKLEGWPLIVILGLGALLLFALTVEAVKKRLLMNAISARLQNLEKDSRIEKFPSSTKDLIRYVRSRSDDSQEHPAENDPVYNLFVWSHARGNLTIVIFIAAILVSLLAEWEFIKFFPYKEWALLAGTLPIAIISILIAIFRYGKSQSWHYRNLLNKIGKVDKSRLEEKDIDQLNTLNNSVSNAYSEAEVNNEQYTNLKKEISVLYKEIYKKRIESLRKSSKENFAIEVLVEKLNEDITDSHSKGMINKEHYEDLKNEVSRFSLTT